MTVQLGVSASLYWTADNGTYLDVIAANLPSLANNRVYTLIVSRGNVYSVLLLKRNNTNCKAFVMPHFGTSVIVATMTNGTWEERTI